MLHAARWKCRMQKIAQNSPSAHHGRGDGSGKEVWRGVSDGAILLDH